MHVCIHVVFLYCRYKRQLHLSFVYITWDTSVFDCSNAHVPIAVWVIWHLSDLGGSDILKFLKFLRDLRMLAKILTLLCHSQDSVAVHINCINPILDLI